MIDETVVERIQNIYQSSSPQEKVVLHRILQEIADTGDSQTYRDVWLEDFKEVPVSIEQFISDPYYLGQTNRNGQAVYPYWRQMLKDLFTDANKYNSVVLTGSTRVGKTSTSIVIASYMLYRLMLYRNPHEYFQKKEVSRFTLAFANLTKELAMSVAYREFNDTLKESPWFMDRGKVSASDRNFYYIPEGDKIEIIPASDAAMVLGKQLWCCLVGTTKIVTSSGAHEIKDLDGSTLYVLQLDYHRKECCYAEARVALTKYVSDTIKIELEDGSIIEGTPDHRVLLSDGSYKRLDELTEDDDLAEVI